MRGGCSIFSKVRTYPLCWCGLSLDTETSGTFAETGSPEDQLHWIFENAKVVRDADGVSCIVEAIKIATRKHDFLW